MVVAGLLHMLTNSARLQEDEFASCSSGGSDSEDVRDEAEPMDQDVPRQGRDELMEAAAEVRSRDLRPATCDRLSSRREPYSARVPQVDVPALLAPRNLMRMEVDEEDEEVRSRDQRSPVLQMRQSYNAHTFCRTRRRRRCLRLTLRTTTMMRTRR